MKAKKTTKTTKDFPVVCVGGSADGFNAYTGNYGIFLPI